MSSWNPSCSLDTLQKKANYLREIRQFFFERNVLEVHTPALAHASVTDVHLHSLETHLSGTKEPLYLQTSPEFYMKRLLCAGSGCIYQINSAFRNEEIGRMHQPEFMMLEWYRVGFDHQDLIAEVSELLQQVLGCGTAEVSTYQELFIQHLDLDPLTADLEQLRACATAQGFDTIAATETHTDTLLQLLFSMCIEPKLGQQVPQCVTDFPASQSALAKLNPKDPRVADRFEFYVRGIELANGFHELQDPKEQRCRFEADQGQRAALGLPERAIDEALMQALEQGLPDCAGVALGLDRLLMLALHQDDIRKVQSFALV